MKEIIEQPKSFVDVRALLKGYLSPHHSPKGAYTLERIGKLMDFLGNPQNDYKIIHVAGTSGKTSTCYYVAALLKQAGIKTGLSVSPHIDELNERTQIQLEPLSEARFCKEFAIFHNIVQQSGISPTYFELLTAFAFWEFKRAKCEYAVIEVGIGGLLDATNVIFSKDKLAVITDIGLDHQEVLGKSLPEIAAQKSGIIKPYNSVVSYNQAQDVMEIIRQAASRQHAELHEILPIKNSQLPEALSLFQRRNWYLAVATYKILASKNNLPELNQNQLLDSTSVYIPARMEILQFTDKTVILDGSHNQQKLETLVGSLTDKYPHQKFTILASFVNTKQDSLVGCIKALMPICDQLIITTFATENNEKASTDPSKVVAACESVGLGQWRIILHPEKAFEELLHASSSVVLVTGSFYLLNHIRPKLKIRLGKGDNSFFTYNSSVG